jgi:phage FluMu gp28-like protein
MLRTECDRDGALWLKFVVTRDEADPEHSVKPFPVHLGYLNELWRVFNTRQLVVVAKSRQMLISWVVAAYCVWVARSKPHQAIYWQAQKDKDAIAMVSLPKGGVQGRCQFIETHLPTWLQKPVETLSGRLVYPNGSFIEALAGGADQVRGKVFSVYVGDEFAHQEDQAGVYTSVAPLIQKGSRAILVSTPNGSTNLFATLFHGRPVAEGAPRVGA